MKIPYKSKSPNTGVSSYELLDDAILLEFTDHKFQYLYNAEKPGSKHVAIMRKLAEQGKGLSTYINQHVRENYARKLAPHERPHHRS
jgi:hypothetical protein